MATWSKTVQGAIVGQYARIWIKAERTDAATTSTLVVTVGFHSKYSTYDKNNSFYFDNLASSGSAKTLVKSGLDIVTNYDWGTGWDSSNSITLWTKTYTYTRQSSDVTRYLYAKITNVDVAGGTMYANMTVTIPKLVKYTISYNANGGSGAPSSQSKTHGVDLVLSKTTPTRSGYKFSGWRTSDGTTYQPGATYKKNASMSLSAVWTANTYKVTYNANGGSGAPAAQTKTHGIALTLSSTKPTRTNYTFKGWGTSTSATTVSYAAGADYTKNAAITLYAIWQLAYVKPRITNLKVSRCDSGGAANEAGTYALVYFKWACDKTVSSIKIEWKPSTSSSWSSTTVTASGTSGTVSTVVGSGNISVENTYTVRITVTDSGGNTAKTALLNGTLFAMDVITGGDGIAFGKPAESHGYMDVLFKTRHRDNVLIDNAKALYGKSADGTADLSLIYVNDRNNTVVGYGGYSKTLGATNVYGNNVNIQAKDTVCINGHRMAANKVLWSGGSYMSSSQTATLSEAISTQANGIVLVWSYYNGGSQNSNWNTIFVPKYVVGAHSGNGFSVFLTTATGNSVAIKYLYISDTAITGYTHETDSTIGNAANSRETTSGITVTPRAFVLRYVIGV